MTDPKPSQAAPRRAATSSRPRPSRRPAAGLAGLGLASNAHAAGSDTIKVGLIGCGGRGTGAAEQSIAVRRRQRQARRHGRRVPGPARRLPRATSRTQARRQGRRRRRPLLRRLRRLQEGDRQRRRPRDPGHAAGLPPDAPGRGRRGGQARLHREAGRRRRARHPQGPGRRRGGQEEEASPSSPAPSAGTRPATSRA